MPKPIDHNVRKRQIVAESVKLFARYGFSDVNFALIAKESGVSRTLLYTYFKDKRQIFNEAINEATDVVGARYRARSCEVRGDPSARHHGGREAPQALSHRPDDDVRSA